MAELTGNIFLTFFQPAKLKLPKLDVLYLTFLLVTIMTSVIATLNSCPKQYFCTCPSPYNPISPLAPGGSFKRETVVGTELFSMA